jgi:FAD:protein FMN transferase
MYTSTVAVKSMGKDKTSVTSRYGTSRLRVGMGTFIAIDAGADTAQELLAGIDAAFAAVSQVERLMHPARRESDLPAIRRSKPGLRVAVHPWTWEVLALSSRLNRMSKGAFDPCVPGSGGGIADLEFAAPNFVIPHRPLHIDLGGIAKGYAVDRAITALRGAGCRHGLVNAGGDLAVFGERSHGAVIRGIGEGILEIKNAALATSDVCGAARPAEHRGYYHGANHRTIKSGGVTISAASAVIADALTKCLLAGEGEMNTELLDTFAARRVMLAADS